MTNMPMPICNLLNRMSSVAAGWVFKAFTTLWDEKKLVRCILLHYYYVEYRR